MNTLVRAGVAVLNAQNKSPQYPQYFSTPRPDIDMASTTDSTISRKRARRVVQRLIDEKVAERSDVFYMNDAYDVTGLAERAAEAFGTQKSQMNALEQTALNAATFGEIINYVKSQVGRSTRAGKQWRRQDIGAGLHDELERVGDQAESHAEDLIDGLDGDVQEALKEGDESSRDVTRRLERDLARRLRVRYAQALIGHIVAHYNYVVGTKAAPA